MDLVIEDVVEYLIKHLKLKIDETNNPYTAPNCRNFEIKLVLLPHDIHSERAQEISSETLTIYEGQR